MALIKQTGFSPGQRYTVQVRAKSKTDRQRISEWSNAFSFTTTNDTVPPMPVSNLTMEPKGTSFIAKWDAPTQNANGTTCTDLAGYYIYFYETDNDSFLTREIFTVDSSYTLSFDDNKEMFGTPKGKITIVVVAADQMGNRSEKNEIAAENPPPADVTGLIVEPGVESIGVSWDANEEDDDLVGYKVYVSTSSSDFVPDATNLKYIGPGTAFMLPTGNPVVHHVKVRAVDVFGLESVNDAYGSATPKTTTGADATPPSDPSNVIASTVFNGAETRIKLSWTEPEDSDLEGVMVRYSTDNVDWSYVRVPAGSTSTIINNVDQDTDYYISVRAIDLSGNNSSWANVAPFPYHTDKNLTAPNKPSAPTVEIDPDSSIGIWIKHDLTDSASNKLEDIATLKVYRSDSSSGNTGTGAPFAVIAVNPGDLFAGTLVPMVGSDSQTDKYWYVVAVNQFGIESPVSDAVKANPTQLSGTNLKNASIDDAKINNLSANKLTANSAFVNDLFIHSQLTIDDETGSIESSDYDANTVKGWKIDKSGIVVNEGSIKSGALEVQSSPNICPPQYSSFEFNNEMYADASGAPNAEYLSVDTGIKISTDLDAKYGNKTLKINDTTTVANKVVALNKAGNYTADVDSLQSYIVSAYIKNTSATAVSVKLRTVSDDNVTTDSEAKSIKLSDGYVRFYFVVDMSATARKLSVRLVKTSAAVATLLLDGVQIERKISKSVEPSNYSPPGMTSMNGEGIITGSIRSSAPAVGVPGQPAWSLNTQGNMQVGDALVRGNLTVGAGSDTTNSMVKSSDYQAGVSGWVIRGDGYAEFNTGTFRSEMLVERYIQAQDVTLRLKGSLADNIIYTPGAGTGNQTVISSPILSGQHYGYNRTQTTGGWYVPTVPVKDHLMTFSAGPTSARNFVIQTKDDSVGGVYGSLPPDNVLANTITLGEQIDYSKSQVIRETTGFDQISYIRENPDRTYSTSTGVNQSTKNKYYNTNFTRINGSLNIRSPFSPESNDRQTDARDYYSNAVQTLESQASYYGPARNLIPSPYDYMLFDTSFNSGNPEDNLYSSGKMNRANCTITTSAYPIIGDPNYRVASATVKITTGSANAAVYFAPTSQSTSNTTGWTNAGIRPNTTYVFSVYIKADFSDSPTSDWLLGAWPRIATGTTTYENYAYMTTVPAGASARRFSVSFTTPASVTGRIQIALYFPAQSILNGKRIAFTRPQLEEVIWKNDPNPEIANSLAPTAWMNNGYGIRSENKTSLKIVTNTSTDVAYDAYGRYDPDFGGYAAEQLKTYREAPNYIDMILDRKSYKTNTSGERAAYSGDQDTTVYRFAEAGIMQPGAYEPMRPAGVEFKLNDLNISPRGWLFTSDMNQTIQATAYGYGSTVPGIGDLRPRDNKYAFQIMRTGFYYAQIGVNILQTTDADLWMTFEVNDVTVHAQGAPRSFTHGWNTNTVIFLQKGDLLSMKAFSGPNNGPSDWFLLQAPRIVVMRLS